MSAPHRPLCGRAVCPWYGIICLFSNGLYIYAQSADILANKLYLHIYFATILARIIEISYIHLDTNVNKYLK